MGLNGARGARAREKIEIFDFLLFNLGVKPTLTSTAHTMEMPRDFVFWDTFYNIFVRPKTIYKSSKNHPKII